MDVENRAMANTTISDNSSTLVFIQPLGIVAARRRICHLPHLPLAITLGYKGERKPLYSVSAGERLLLSAISLEFANSRARRINRLVVIHYAPGSSFLYPPLLPPVSLVVF